MKSTLTIHLLTLTLAVASKCPEARKPHVTGCSIYYECINLPEGGYVWAPAKCPEGLVFQPYIRLCVLPGDTWTCVEPIQTVSKPPNSPELIDETKTSYHELNPSSIESNGFFNFGNFPPIIPFPLIEVESLKKMKHNIQPPLEAPNSVGKKKIQRVDGVTHVIFYKNPFSPSPVIDMSKNEFIVQFIRNYIFNRTVNSRSDRNRAKNCSTTTERNPSGDEPEVSEIPLNGVIDEENNVIAIRGNLGIREYVTPEKYKSLSAKVKIEVLDIVPCTSGIRLPNVTNCMKYYMCEPKTAEVHDFTCPQNTAFNAQINLCDQRKYKSCRKITEGVQVEKLSLLRDNEGNEPRNNPCEKAGKYPDKNSERFYHLCYTDEHSATIKSVRLACPNNLMFCETRKACSSKRFCYGFK